MIFQYVLKGIAGLTALEAEHVMEHGLKCRWWHRVDPLPWDEVPGRMTEAELQNHLAHYNDSVPGQGYTYGEDSPFISTTAGTYQTPSSRTYKLFSATYTAISFATKGFTSDGVVFAAWLPVLGRPSLPLLGFGEEVRDPNQYPKAYGFHHQGEVTAKIHISPTQIAGYTSYVGAKITGAGIAGGHVQDPTNPSFVNPRYIAPEDYANVRGLT